MQKIRKAVVLLAGYGTRCLPFTKILPKAMIPILNQPTIHYIVEEIEKSGFEEIIFILPKDCNGKVIKQYFKPNHSYERFLIKRKNKKALETIRQIKTRLKTKFVVAKPNGSGGAVLQTKRFIHNEPFAVFNGDDMFVGDKMPFAEILEKHEKTNASVIGVKEVHQSDVSKYGIVESNRDGLIKQIFEKPQNNETKSRFASFGRYLFTPEIFQILKVVKPQKNKEIYITDAIQVLTKNKSIYMQPISAKRFDCGDEKEILFASIYMSKSKIYHDEVAQFIKENLK